MSADLTSSQLHHATSPFNICTIGSCVMASALILRQLPAAMTAALILSQLPAAMTAALILSTTLRHSPQPSLPTIMSATIVLLLTYLYTSISLATITIVITPLPLLGCSFLMQLCLSLTLDLFHKCHQLLYVWCHSLHWLVSVDGAVLVLALVLAQESLLMAYITQAWLLLSPGPLVMPALPWLLLHGLLLGPHPVSFSMLLLLLNLLQWQTLLILLNKLLMLIVLLHHVLLWPQQGRLLVRLLMLAWLLPQ